MATLNDLTKNLTLQKDDGPITAVRLVKGYDKSYALNAAGQITALSLGNSKIKKLVLGAEAANVEYLYLSGSKSLTEVVFEVPLPHLTHLYLNNCAITQITFPAGFRSLQQIYLQKNGLQRLVFEGDCPALVLMDVSENKLEEFDLPQGFFNLTYLYLSSNRLKSLTAVNLPNLSTLYLDSNQFSNLPFNYQKKQSDEIQLCLPQEPLGALEFLRLSTNPLPDDVRGFVENRNNCLREIKAYFNDLSKGDTLDNEYKTLIIGNGNVGKSCLVERLVYNRFKNEWDSTHGISLEQFAHQDYVFNLWDFGGQDIYHATHRLFMQSNALYLVLWDSKTEQSAFTEHQIGGECRQYDNYQLSYWLDYTHNQGKNSPVIVVQTKTKRDGEVYLAEIQTLYNKKFSFLKFCHIDSQEDDWDGNGFNSLLTAMRLAAKSFNRKQRTPKNRAALRQALRLKQKAGEKFLSLDDYLILAKEVTDSISVLENWLVKTGVVFYRAGLFNNSIILDQAWAIEAIYTIFRRTTEKGRRNITYYDILSHNGRFTGDDLQGIWEETYNPQEQELFVSFMLSCELCFETTFQEHPDLKEWEVRFEQRSFVAPQLMPEKKPNSVEDVWEGRSSWYLTYRHDFLHYGVIQSFIVRTQTLAEMRDIWKSGISLKETTDNGAVHFALVECQGNEIRVRVTQGGTILLNKIRNLFEKLRDSKGTETVSLDGKNYVLLDELKNRSKDNPQLKTVDGKWIAATGLEVFLDRDEGVSFEKPESTVRSLGKENETTNKKMIDNSKPYPVPMAEGAREFVPFSEVEGKIKILFLAATPMDAGQLNTGKESRFKDLFRYFDTEKRFLLKEEHGITTEQFQNFVISENPHIVHYGGHGEEEGIVLEDENLEADILLGILQLSEKVQCVVLNACNSLAIAETLAQDIPYVIATQDVIDDRTAIAFAKGFYIGIVAGKTIENSFQLGVLSVKREKLPDSDVLILVKGTISKS